MTSKENQEAPTPYEKFENFVARIVSVPKKEVDEKEKERPKRKPRKSS